MMDRLQAWERLFFPSLPPEDARREVRAAVLEALGWTPLEFINRCSVPLEPEVCRRVEAVLRRRAAGEPLSRIMGVRGFWKHTFQLSPETLDPRPETEGMIEVALDFFQKTALPQIILDLGTGSGCLLISLLLEFPEALGMGVDLDPKALEMARRNATILGAGGRATWVCSPWADGLSSTFQADLIVSNPPYIAAVELPLLPPEVRLHDPARALDGGEDGLDCYRHLIPQAAARLTARGCLILEIGHMQGKAVRALLEPFFQTIAIFQDLSGHDRIILAHEPFST